MKNLSLFIFVAILAVVSCNLRPHEGDLVASDPPVVRLDLNVDPEHRWDHIIPQYKDILQLMCEKVFDPLGISDKTYNQMGLFFTTMYQYKDFIKEIKGIAKAADIKWQKILLANFLYEYSTIPMCSSILVRNKFNKILHGRNLDFSLWNYLSKMTAKVQVYKGDKHIGTWDQFIGSVIVLTGFNHGSFSLTEDTRVYKGPLIDILDNIVIKQYMPSAFLTRYVLQNEMSYTEARDTLLNSNTTSTIYYIIGGDEEGTVIEKNMEGYNRKQEVTPESENWFVVQTNYDLNEDPATDDRKSPATIRLENIGQENINEENFFELLQKYPTLNISTVYSILFSVEYGYNKINTWYGNIDDPLPTLGDNEDIFDTDPAYQDEINEMKERIHELVDIIENQNYFGKVLEMYEEEIKQKVFLEKNEQVE